MNSVKLKIDNGAYAEMESTSNKNLYVLKWNPLDFKTGLHRLTVRANVNLKLLLIF